MKYKKSVTISYFILLTSLANFFRIQKILCMTSICEFDNIILQCFLVGFCDKFMNDLK